MIEPLPRVRSGICAPASTAKARAHRTPIRTYPRTLDGPAERVGVRVAVRVGVGVRVDVGVR